MKLIGVTGGVGAGKTAILEYLRTKYKATVILADVVAQEVIAEEGTLREQLVTVFGSEIYNEDGILNKEAIRSIIFHDKEALTKMNGMVHPIVREKIQNQVQQAENEGQLLCVVEAALLLEEHYDDFCDEVWYIYTSVANRKIRLMDSRGYSEKQCEDIMESQLAEETFRNRCQVVIDNNECLDHAYVQIDEAILNMRKELGSNS